jgi:hypothetical protein
MVTTDERLKWGERAAEELEASRAKLLASLPEAAREGGERLLRACESDAAVAASTIAMLACTAAAVGLERHKELSFDVLKTTLEFYRFASMRELVEHQLAAASGPDEAREALKVISAGLTERARPLAARLKVLLEGLKEASEEEGRA